MKMNKKGVLEQLGALGVGVASMTIALVVVFLILARTRANTQVAADANATAAVNTLTNAAADIPTWVPLVIITVIGALLIGLIAMFRGRR